MLHTNGQQQEVKTETKHDCSDEEGSTNLELGKVAAMLNVNEQPT